MPIRPTVLPAFAVFAAAARHQNFAHAAEELHLKGDEESYPCTDAERNRGTLQANLPREVLDCPRGAAGL